MSHSVDVKRGFEFEREIKQHFVDAEWGCTRAAHSASAMDLIAFTKINDYPAHVFIENGYHTTTSMSTKIPLRWLASKIEKKYIKHVYYERVGDKCMGSGWTVVLMQCKIRSR